jgi:hypothetical protein
MPKYRELLGYVHLYCKKRSLHTQLHKLLQVLKAVNLDSRYDPLGIYYSTPMREEEKIPINKLAQWLFRFANNPKTKNINYLKLFLPPKYPSDLNIDDFVKGLYRYYLRNSKAQVFFWNLRVIKDLDLNHRLSKKNKLVLMWLKQRIKIQLDYFGVAVPDQSFNIFNNDIFEGFTHTSIAEEKEILNDSAFGEFFVYWDSYADCLVIESSDKKERFELSKTEMKQKFEGFFIDDIHRQVLKINRKPKNQIPKEMLGTPHNRLNKVGMACERFIF